MFKQIQAIEKKMLAQQKKRARKVGIKVAQYILSHMSRSLTAISPGIEYTRKGIKHIASKPGDPPNMDQGDLSRSLQIQTTTESIAVGSFGMPYAFFLEYGTSKMGARPFFHPAIDKALTKFKVIIE